jgi:hypothetical protein
MRLDADRMSRSLSQALTSAKRPVPHVSGGRNDLCPGLEGGDDRARVWRALPFSQAGCGLPPAESRLQRHRMAAKCISRSACKCDLPALVTEGVGRNPVRELPRAAHHSAVNSLHRHVDAGVILHRHQFCPPLNANNKLGPLPRLQAAEIVCKPMGQVYDAPDGTAGGDILQAHENRAVLSAGDRLAESDERQDDE